MRHWFQTFFVGKDVATALGYSNSRDALNKHVDPEDRGTVAIRDTAYETIEKQAPKAEYCDEVLESVSRSIRIPLLMKCLWAGTCASFQGHKS